MLKKSFDETLQQLKEDIISAKEILIMLIEQPKTVLQIFGGKAARPLIDFHNQFQTVLTDPVIQHKYKTSLCGLKVGDEFIVSGLKQGSCEKLSTFLVVLTNLSNSTAFIFLQNHMAVVKKAAFALRNQNYLDKIIKEALRYCALQGFDPEYKDTLLSNALNKIITNLNETIDFCPLTISQQLLTLCDKLLSISNNLEIVKKLHKFYDILYASYESVSDPSQQFRIIVGYALYQNSAHDEKWIANNLKTFPNRLSSTNNFYNELRGILSNFIDGGHYRFLLKEFNNNQSLVIWETFLQLLEQNSDRTMLDKIKGQIDLIKTDEAHCDTDDELVVTPLLTSDFDMEKVTDASPTVAPYKLLIGAEFAFFTSQMENSSFISNQGDILKTDDYSLGNK